MSCALWLVLISRPPEGRRLSWPEWLVTLQYTSASEVFDILVLYKSDYCYYYCKTVSVLTGVDIQ